MPKSRKKVVRINKGLNIGKKRIKRILHLFEMVLSFFLSFYILLQTY